MLVCLFAAISETCWGLVFDSFPWRAENPVFKKIFAASVLTIFNLLRQSNATNRHTITAFKLSLKDSRVSSGKVELFAVLLSTNWRRIVTQTLSVVLNMNNSSSPIYSAYMWQWIWISVAVCMLNMNECFSCLWHSYWACILIIKKNKRLMVSIAILFLKDRGSLVTVLKKSIKILSCKFRIILPLQPSCLSWNQLWRVEVGSYLLMTLIISIWKTSVNGI